MHAEEPFELDPLLTFSLAREYFEPVNGKRPSPKVLARYAEKGVRGVRLQSEWRGGRRCTRPSWIEAFQRALNPARAAESEMERLQRLAAIRGPRKDAQVQRQLAARGYLGGQKRREVLGLPRCRGRSRLVQAGLPGGEIRNQDGQGDGAGSD